MSLCDTCPKPGQCCRILKLWGHGLENPDTTDEEAVHVLERINKTAEWPVPFVPFGRAYDGSIKFTCPKLGNDGRCTDYANRPDVCRHYQPKQDALCVLYEDEGVNHDDSPG